MQNFTIADLVQTKLATLALALFLLPPGYLLGLASNAFGMRSRSAAEKILFSAAYSVAITPILAVLVTRLSSYKVTIAFFLVLAVISIATLVRQLPLPAGFLSRVQRSTWILLGMMLAWFVVVQFSLADLQIGHRLYVNYVAYDHSVRVPFVEAAARTGVPPLNPFYGLGEAPVLRYFYYWYVVCALPMRLFGLSAKACLSASVFWSGVGLASIIPLFLKYVLYETENLRKKTVIGIALLTVTGLDILPFAYLGLRLHLWLGDIEWWEPNQVTSWLGSLLWVPHHVASLTACMAGLLMLSSIDEASSPGQRIWGAVISGLAFASAAGLSVYVTFTFAIFAIFWFLQLLFEKKFKTFTTLAAAGVLSLLLSWPYLVDLLSKRIDAAGPGARFAFFALRGFPDVLQIFESLGMHNPLLLNLLQVPILLFVYFVEFGFFALIMWLCLRTDTRSSTPLSRQRRMMWMMFVICLLTMSVLRSDSSGSNDLGFRGMLVVQFVLVLWATPIVYDVFSRSSSVVATDIGGRRWIKASLVLTLLLGVAGTACELLALRFYPLLADAGKITRSESFLGSPGFAERTYWLRRGFDQLNALTPSTAAVQYNPTGNETMMAHLYSTRQAAMGDPECGSPFGGDLQKCKQMYPYVSAVFNSPDAIRDWSLDLLCDEFYINVLVATDVDPAWQDRYGWVWIKPALFANPSMRAIPCGTGARTSPVR